MIETARYRTRLTGLPFFNCKSINLRFMIQKNIEAGGTLAGGHSIADSDVKYGLSVTGLVNPNKIYNNN
mgnify:CR=1 FL=1